VLQLFLCVTFVVVVVALSAPPSPIGIDQASRTCTTSLGRSQRSLGSGPLDFGVAVTKSVIYSPSLTAMPTGVTFVRQFAVLCCRRLKQLVSTIIRMHKMPLFIRLLSCFYWHSVVISPSTKFSCCVNFLTSLHLIWDRPGFPVKDCYHGFFYRFTGRVQLLLPSKQYENIVRKICHGI